MAVLVGLHASAGRVDYQKVGIQERDIPLLNLYSVLSIFFQDDIIIMLMSDDSSQEIVMSEEQVVENKEEKEETKPGQRVTHIDVFGQVGEETLKSFFTTLVRHEPPIEIGGHVQINVSTPGGVSRVGATILEMINTKHDLNGTVVCIGLCASAGYAFLGTRLTTLAYGTTVFMNHGASYQYKDERKDYIIEHIILEERQIANVDNALVEKAGLSEKEYKSQFTASGEYNLGIDVLWFGERGLIDGIIVKDLPEHGWIVMTREGLKQWDSSFKGHIRDEPLLSDKACERFGLKQFVPERPKFKKDKTLRIPGPVFSKK